MRGWRLKGEIAEARLRWQEAEQALRKALTLAKRVGNPTQLWKTHLALGRLYRETRRPDRAGASFTATRQVVAGVGQSLTTPELKGGFERSPLMQTVYEQCRIN